MGVLLQRTRGENAIGVYRSFLRHWPNPDALARARVGTIEAVIRPLGLVRRAAVLKRLGQALVAIGSVPESPDALDRLPGVGPYAAHSVQVFARDQDLPVVDWVIARVLRRFFGLEDGGVRTRTPNYGDWLPVLPAEDRHAGFGSGLSTSRRQSAHRVRSVTSAR